MQTTTCIRRWYKQRCWGGDRKEELMQTRDRERWNKEGTNKLADGQNRDEATLV